MQYYLVNESRYPAGQSGSLSGMLFQIENAEGDEAIVAAVAALLRNFPPHLRSLRRAFTVWLTHVKGLDIKPEDFDDTEGVVNMLATNLQEMKNSYVAQGFEQGIERGMEKGAWEKQLNIARRMIAAGHDNNTIADLTELPLEVIQKLG